MASSKFPVSEPKQFYNQFPHLNGKNHRPTSNATPDLRFGPVRKPYYIYNCFAFVVGDRKRFWWPDDPHSYWPRQNSTDTVDELVAVLRDFGYEECDGSLEKGVQKIAIFAKNGVPQHISIQPSSRGGKWLSKMGFNIDMEHDLRAIETWNGDDPEKHGYGKIVKFMRLPLRKRR